MTFRWNLAAKGSFQAAKLQRSARAAVCSHSIGDMAAIRSIESQHDYKGCPERVSVRLWTAMTATIYSVFGLGAPAYPTKANRRRKCLDADRISLFDPSILVTRRKCSEFNQLPLITRELHGRAKISEI
jgi:hypothetical protein